MTPHIHWHVIPRFSDDRHFPQPVWEANNAPVPRHGIDALAQLRRQLSAVLGENQKVNTHASPALAIDPAIGLSSPTSAVAASGWRCCR